MLKCFVSEEVVADRLLNGHTTCDKFGHKWIRKLATDDDDGDGDDE